MKLPKSRKEKIRWYVVLPFVTFTISGIFLYLMDLLIHDIIGLVAWIIIMPLWIGLLGMGADEAIKKVDFKMSLFTIKKHSKIGITSVILPIIAIIIIILKKIIPEIFENNIFGSMIYDSLIIVGISSIFLGLIAILGKNKDTYGLIGISLAIIVSLMNAIL